MATRSETAAATRRSLLDAAAALLDHGGPEAVTLREVGARAGPKQARRYGALLLSAAHGITGLELSGHLAYDKRESTAEELIDTIIARLPTRVSS